MTLRALFHEKAHSVKTDVVVATVCWGSYAVLSLSLLSKYPPLVIASLTMLFAGLRVVPLALLGFLIVDPACGSGSFLIGAYQYLLDLYRDRYVEDSPEKWSDRLYKGRGGQWHLTIDEKKRILLNNIHGVDIDSQAVEVTKLSLLVKVLEGESEASLATQLRRFQERALPDLDKNIKCGNSLIGLGYNPDNRSSCSRHKNYWPGNRHRCCTCIQVLVSAIQIHASIASKRIGHEDALC